MTTLSQGQIKAYAASVGMTNPSLMAAIAMAESGGRTDVVNSIGCVGPLQINQRVHVQSHPTWTVAYLQQPLNNFRAGKVIYNSQGLSAWEAYTNGAYKKYYSGSTGSIVDAGLIDTGEALIPGAGLVAGDSPLEAPLAAVKMAARAGTWISTPSNWLRVLYVVAGVGVIWIAAEKTVLQSGPAKQVLSVVGGTTGKVTKAVKEVGSNAGNAA